VCVPPLPSICPHYNRGILTILPKHLLHTAIQLSHVRHIDPGLEKPQRSDLLSPQHIRISGSHGPNIISRGLHFASVTGEEARLSSSSNSSMGAAIVPTECGSDVRSTG